MKWLKNSVVLECVAAIVIVLGAYLSGYKRASTTYQLEIKSIQYEHAQAVIQSQNDYAKALSKANAEKQLWYDFAHEQGIKLVQATQELDKQNVKIKQEIEHVIKSDSRHCNGIGSNSLQLYKRALGYTD